MIRLAVAGAGDWGRNHVRVLANLPGVRLDWIADPDVGRWPAAQALAPRATCVGDVGEALHDDRLDGVVVSSPGPTHGRVARAALRAGKHVLVEKPLTPTGEESWDLVRRARRADRLLGVGHLLLYHPAVRALKREIDIGRLGAVRYMHCQRTNLGRIRRDEGALVSLAPHDISVMVHLLGDWPVGVSARGAVCAQPEFEDIVFVTLRFGGGRLGNIHLSWLDPLKVRRISVVGEGRMAVFDDMSDDKLRVVSRVDGSGPIRNRVRRPRVSAAEPLREELRAFVSAIRDGGDMPTPGEDGARVVRVLEAAQRSIDADGREFRVRIR